MFDRTQYPLLYRFFEHAAGHLLATHRMKTSPDASIPAQVVEQMALLSSKFGVVVAALIVHLFDHPERWAEAERLVKFQGCPAQMIPILEAYLEMKCD